MWKALKEAVNSSVRVFEEFIKLQTREADNC
jgi:hypothetical protein